MTTVSPILKEARRLYDLGFSLLWLRPKSKAPVKSKWTSGSRDTWTILKNSYKPGYNLGVRLGRTSEIDGKYLAVIDVDIKSTEKKHKLEALKAIKELFPDLPVNPIQVKSGRGNGSCHIYMVTTIPAMPCKLRVSSDKVKVLMPSASINASQREALTEEDLNEGWRIRPAWEIAVMGEGQQVVLPPSTHPDTNREYAWEHRLLHSQDLVEIKLKGKKESKDSERSLTQNWVATHYDLKKSSLPQDIKDLLYDADCPDRSAGLFKVAIAMIRDNSTDHQIMTVLTNTDYELGKVAFEHAKTTDRRTAANWIYNYTIKKARAELDAQTQFDEEVEVVSLEEDEIKAQAQELLISIDWRDRLERNGPKGQNANCPRPTLKNLILILTNEVAVDVFKRDEFAHRDFYGHSTPWGGRKGEMLNDNDAIKIKVWLGHRYRFEPKKELIFEVMSFLCEKNCFDPVREWLETLPEWDGLNRLDTWLAENFEAEGDPDYLAQVFRKWMVAMIMRDFNPGSKFDWMPIFEGRQGIGKSSIGRLLVGEKYFLDWLPDLSDKDSALSLQGAWAVEFGELANLRKQDVESAKAFVSRTVDKVRPPYGRIWIESPRRCVFFGTTNSDTYLRDDSGNRRFKPIKVGQLNFEALERDREQLFAEALFIYKNEFETQKTLDIEGDRAREYEAQVQSEKMMEDESSFMIEDLKKFIKEEAQKTDKTGTFNFQKFKLTHLFEGFSGPLKGYRSDMRHLLFAAKAIRALKGEKFKSNGSVFWKMKIDEKGNPVSPTLTLYGKQKNALDLTV